MDKEKKELTLRDKFLSITPSLIENVERFKRKSKYTFTEEICAKTLERLKELQQKEILFKGQEGKKEIDSMIHVLTFIVRRLFTIDNVKAYNDKNDDGRALVENFGNCNYQSFVIETYLSSILTEAYSCAAEEYANFCDGFRKELQSRAWRLDPDFGDYDWMP